MHTLTPWKLILSLEELAPHIVWKAKEGKPGALKHNGQNLISYICLQDSSQ